MSTHHPRLFRLSAIAFGLIILVALAGCDILGLSEEDPAPTAITDYEAIAGMEVVGGMMEAIFEGGGEPATGETFPDFASGTYPAGMSVSVTASSDSSVTLRATATDLTPPAEDGEVPEDITLNGTFTISLTLNADGTQMTIAMAGSFTVTGSDAPFSSMSVENAVAVMPMVNGEPGEPSSMTGTLTVDGTAYDMARIDTDADSDSGGTASPTDAHYFLFGYWQDGATDRPQVVYSETTAAWDTIDLSGAGRFQAAAIDGNGLIVAVGENGLIYSSADGATWTARSSGTTADLYDVQINAGTWIAVGEQTILRSTNGTTWTTEWSGSAGETLFAVSPDGPGGWIAMGAPPHVIVLSADDGATWTAVDADLTNRPLQIIRHLFRTTDDTEWIALSGDTGFSGGIYDGTDLESDGDLDWELNGSPFEALAGAERDGVYVAIGNGITLRYSSDSGDTWSSASVTDPINGHPVDMTAIGNGFLAVTNMGGLLRGSADATTWQVVDDESWGSFAVVFRP